MADWFDRMFPKAPPSSSRQVAPLLPDIWGQFLPPAPQNSVNPGQIPNASLIYGMAAAAFFGIALYFLFTGLWLTGLLMFLPASAFLGYALHFLRGSV